jgi:chloramphenicol-sensitive protein RarD
MKQEIPNQTKRGIAFALTAFVVWGLNPLYFRMIREVSAPEIIAHRILWMLIILFSVSVFTRKLPVLKGFLRNPRIFGLMVVSSLLIITNWLVFTWAVTHDRVVDTSMGYFINPLCNVFLGMVFLRERLRTGQVVSVLLAGSGVLYMIIQNGTLPWIAIVLPASFGTYGLLRKRIPVDSFNGLLMEAIILSPLALGYLAYLGGQNSIVFLNEGLDLKLLIMLCGPITIVPLMCFASGLKRIPYSTIGILQYLAPTMTFLLGVFAFGEAFDHVQMITFGCIWASLILFSIEGFLHGRRISQGTPELSYNVK